MATLSFQEAAARVTAPGERFATTMALKRERRDALAEGGA